MSFADMFKGHYKKEKEELKEENERMKQILERERAQKKKLSERVSELYALSEGWMQGYNKAEVNSFQVDFSVTELHAWRLDYSAES